MSNRHRFDFYVKIFWNYSDWKCTMTDESNGSGRKTKSIRCFSTGVLNFSGGNKRKVSAAIAFMANPTLVFLDEPTTVEKKTRKKKREES